MICLLAGSGFNTLIQPQLRGMQRARAADSLAKIVWYYHTHLAAYLNAVRCPKGRSANG